MELLASAWDLALHLDQHLAAFVAEHGRWVYALLFVIVFCETGLVVTPFLPGDSLLFVVGALAAAGGMDITLVMATLIVAALCGDNANYWIGRWTGTRWLKRWINPAHLERTHDFYERHGGKTIVIARFVPIIRTFAPVVAGVGQMKYRSFVFYNIAGGLLWIWSMLFTGYFLGRYIPGIDEHIEIVILVVVFLSIMPGIIHWYKERKRPAPAPSAAERPAAGPVAKPVRDAVRDV